MSSAVSTEPEIALEIGLGGGFVKKNNARGELDGSSTPLRRMVRWVGSSNMGRGRGGRMGGARREMSGIIYIFFGVFGAVAQM